MTRIGKPKRQHLKIVYMFLKNKNKQTNQPRKTKLDLVTPGAFEPRSHESYQFGQFMAFDQNEFFFYSPKTLLNLYYNDKLLCLFSRFWFAKYF